MGIFDQIKATRGKHYAKPHHEYTPPVLGGKSKFVPDFGSVPVAVTGYATPRGGERITPSLISHKKPVLSGAE